MSLAEIMEQKRTQTSFRIPDELLQRFKIIAIKKRCSINDLVNSLIEEYVRKEEENLK